MVEFAVRKFNKEQHIELFREWRAASSDTREFDEGALSTTGFMAYEIEHHAVAEWKPVMCAFLVLTNTNWAIGEAVTANPRTSQETREAALKALTDTMVIHAKALGFKRLLAYTNIESLGKKCVNVGWIAAETNVTGYLKELT